MLPNSEEARGVGEEPLVSDLVAAYLFCAGAGSGAALLTALLGLAARRGCLRRWLGSGDPRARAARRRVAVASYGAALALLAFGMLCLVFDLGRPELALKLFFRPNPTLVTAGSYLLVLLAAALMIPLVLELADAPRRGVPDGVRVAAQVVAAIAALGVMAYAGLLLGQADEAPLFGTLGLPVLFVASALASGLAVAMLALLVAGDERPAAACRIVRRLTIRADVALIIVEAAATALYLVSVAAGPGGAEAAAPLLSGAQSGLFVGGFTLMGLGAPLVLDLLQLRFDLPGWAYPLAAAATLIGAACLRVALIHAGSPVLEAPLVGGGFAEAWRGVA